MPFFQNLFESEFRGSWVFASNQHSATFIVPGNKNTTEISVAWNVGPYDLSSTNTLTFNYSLDPNRQGYASFGVNIAGSTASATTAEEIVTILNNNNAFLGLFVADVLTWKTGNTLRIRTIKNRENIRYYISNSGAESKLRFNKRAGVAEIPSYFSRHTIANINTFSDCAGLLVQLDGTDTAIDRPIIRDALNNQSWTNSDLKADWQLIPFNNSSFIFKKQTIDGSGRITQIIAYSAGSVAGDLATKTTMSYTGANTVPDVVAEVPYVLQSGDLITPP